MRTCGEHGLCLESMQMIVRVSDAISQWTYIINGPRKGVTNRLISLAEGSGGLIEVDTGSRVCVWRVWCVSMYEGCGVSMYEGCDVLDGACMCVWVRVYVYMMYGIVNVYMK